MSTGTIYNGMGQGDVLVTPAFELANYTAAIANKGSGTTPTYWLKSIDGKPNPDPRFKNKHLPKFKIKNIMILY